MKKIKIMLTAVILLGTVGGVLAYKAKRTTKICTTATVNFVCPARTLCGTIVTGKTTAAGGGIVCTAALLSSGVCPALCPNFARTIAD